MARKENVLSEYEIQRQANIAKNKALLQELHLNAASAGLAPNASRSKRAAPGSASRKKPAPGPKVKQEDYGPRRTSSRLKGIVADSEVARVKAEEEHEAFREADRAKRRRVTGDLKLGDVLVAGQHWTQSGNWLSDVGPAKPYERTFDEADGKETSSKEMRELREKMGGLELWAGCEPSRIKITPDRIYCMAFHPTPEKPLVFAGDKLGNLGLFDGSQRISDVKDEDDEVDQTSSPAITTFKLHSRTISTIHFTPSQPHVLFTSSYDSSIRKLDLEKGVAAEVYAPSPDTDEALSGVSIPSTDPSLLYFTTLTGLFGIHDTRVSNATTTTELLRLSEKKIGGFSIHPLHPHLLATASLDRHLKLWDLRKISGKGEARLPTLVGEHESPLSVSHAAFNAAGQIATSSYDDTIKIHNLSDCGAWSAGKTLTDAEISPSTVIRHNNQTGRWVTILRPHWQAIPSSVGGGAQRFCIANMNRFVDIYAGNGEQLAQLGGGNITAVPAVAVFHESMDWVAGGTGSGKLALWM